MDDDAPPMPSLPAMPEIPAQFSVPRTTPPAVVEEIRPASPLRKVVEDDGTPAGRVRKLEYEQETLEGKKRRLRKRVWELEQRLPPNECSAGPEQKRMLMEDKERREREVADVEKELHDLGMRLHRAYRRLDEGEGKTHLWISRATSA